MPPKKQQNNAAAAEPAAAQPQQHKKKQHVDAELELLNENVHKREAAARKEAKALERQRHLDAQASQQDYQKQVAEHIINQRRVEAIDREHINTYRKMTNTAWFPASDKTKTMWVRYEQFTEGSESDRQMEDIIALFAAELSEPYSAFTYHHFIFGWRDLCIMVFGHVGDKPPAEEKGGKLIGCVTSKVSRQFPKALRGYVAMLAVSKEFRGHNLGKKLVAESVELMKQKHVEEVLLETPLYNDRALNLYTSLGFVKTKYLTQYYMDGSDAVRLKLFLRDPVETLRRQYAQQQHMMQAAAQYVQQAQAQAVAAAAAGGGGGNIKKGKGKKESKKVEAAHQ